MTDVDRGAPDALDAALSFGDTFDGLTFDAEVVRSTPTRQGKPVDPPDHKRVFFDAISHDEHLAPLVPASLHPSNLRSTTTTAVRRTGYKAAFHALRSPKYAWKTALWAPVGIFVGGWKALSWAFDWEADSLRQQAITHNNTADYLKLANLRDKRVGGRAPFAWAGILIGLVVVALLLWVAPPWWKWVALAAIVPVLAVVGRPADKPITDRVTVGGQFIKLTADMTRKAIVAAGAGVKDAASITFPTDIARDGPGWTAIVNLPDGVIATDVIDKRDRLAGGFRLPKPQVWPSNVEGQHPSMLRIWVADRPVSAMQQPPWPLLRGGRADYFKSYPFGFNERLQPTSWSLDQKNSLFAGIPGSGKSLAARVVLLGAILDPLVVPIVFELKGTGDFDAFEPLCPKGLYGSGADEDTKQRALAALEWLIAECECRGPLVKKYAAAGLNNTNNVNRAMAERDPRLRPIVAVFDEIQELLTDPELKKRAVPVATSIIKRGRALGIHLILATQRIDKESIPRGISSNVALRVCMAATSHVEVDLVLGTGAYARGARPTEFETATEGDPKDSGWGWRQGMGPLQPMRAAYVDNVQTGAIVKRAIVERTQLGLMPTDEEVDLTFRDPLADVIGVFRAGEAFVSWKQIAERLAEQQPETYQDVTQETISAQIRALGVPSESGRDGDAVLRGAKRAAIVAAMDRRQIGGDEE